MQALRQRRGAAAAPVDRFDAGPQPAGRPPAPGRLGYVQAFLNSFWDLGGHGDEVWSSPRAYAAWLAARGFGDRATGADLARAIELREALRAVCLANHDGREAREAIRTLDRVALEVARTAGLAPSVAAGTLEAAGDGPDAACALVLGTVLIARADGTFARLKACPHERCGWVFYDVSRNRSSQWCSMRICGNRTKAQAFRRRHTGKPA
jgi:predicted RNA-binding Zn ribbon-like protein